MRLFRVLLLGCMFSLLAGTAVAARGGGGSAPYGPVPKDRAAAQRIAQERAAIDLINKATRHVQAARKDCRLTFPSPTSTPTHDVPTQAVLEQIAALRRPGTAQEAGVAPSFGVAGEIYADYARIVTAANGSRFEILIGRSVQPSYRISSSCLDAEHARLLVLLAGKPKHLRSVTLEEFGKLRHGQEQNSKQPVGPQDGIYLFTYNPGGSRSGGGGGGGDAKRFATHGNFVSFGGGRTSTLNGLVPDGVASVTFEFPKRVSHGRNYKPTVYPSAYTRTVRVQENVLSFRIPRDAGEAFAARMVWRAANGSVIRVIKPPR